MHSDTNRDKKKQDGFLFFPLLSNSNPKEVKKAENVAYRMRVKADISLLNTLNMPNTQNPISSCFTYFYNLHM